MVITLSVLDRSLQMRYPLDRNEVYLHSQNMVTMETDKMAATLVGLQENESQFHCLYIQVVIALSVLGLSLQMRYPHDRNEVYLHSQNVVTIKTDNIAAVLVDFKEN